jgi:hypothetical protein
VCCLCGRDYPYERYLVQDGYCRICQLVREKPHRRQEQEDDSGGDEAHDTPAAPRTHEVAAADHSDVATPAPMDTWWRRNTTAAARGLSLTDSGGECDYHDLVDNLTRIMMPYHVSVLTPRGAAMPW